MGQERMMNRFVKAFLIIFALPIYAAAEENLDGEWRIAGVSCSGGGQVDPKAVWRASTARIKINGNLWSTVRKAEEECTIKGSYFFTVIGDAFYRGSGERLAEGPGCNKVPGYHGVGFIYDGFKDYLAASETPDIFKRENAAMFTRVGPRPSPNCPNNERFVEHYVKVDPTVKPRDGRGAPERPPTKSQGGDR